MKRTYGDWAVNSLRTTMRIVLISDWIRTHHRRDPLRANRKGRNWNRWHESAAYIIDTSGKRPREHAVKSTGHSNNVDHDNIGLFLGLARGWHTAFRATPDQSKAAG